MDRNKPPDEDSLDTRQPLDSESQGRSAEAPERANELVRSDADGVVPRSGTSEVLDPVLLRILLGGGMLIGTILAARLKQVGPVEFYEGVPNELPQVLRAGLESPPS